MKKLILVLMIAAAGIGIYKYLSANPNVSGISDENADLVLYWGDGCSHCEKVKQYISDHDSESKVKIAYKEVYYNRQNQSDLEQTVKSCPEIDSTQGIGVPLAFDTSAQKCLYGDTPIIDWLSSK